MEDHTSGEFEGMSRLISTTPPSHYLVKIQSFSSLGKNFDGTYNSGEFEAEGYKWKLILHPKGNINKNVNDHISLYLRMVVNESSLRPGSEVHAIVRFFLLDQKKENYLVIEDRLRSFDWLKHEWGFDRLVSLKKFEDPSNGYLVSDTCVFGAEVFVCQKKATEKVDCLSMAKSPFSYKHTWKIDNFFKQDATCIESSTFTIEDTKWKIQMYPKGSGEGAGTHISLYLTLANPTSIPPGSRVYAEYTMRIVDQDSNANPIPNTPAKKWFNASTSSWGRHEFISLTEINSSSKGYIKNKSCIVEAEVTVHGVEKPL